MASCSFRLVHLTNPAGQPAVVSGTVGPQFQWTAHRSLTAAELKVVQGFPSDYDLLGNGKHELSYYGSVNSKTPLTHTVRLCETARIHAVGNSVVPLVAKAFLASSPAEQPARRPKRKRAPDTEEREWVDPWEQQAAKCRMIETFLSESRPFTV